MVESKHIAWLCRITYEGQTLSEFAVLQEPKAPFGEPGTDYPTSATVEIVPLIAADATVPKLLDMVRALLSVVDCGKRNAPAVIDQATKLLAKGGA